MPSSPAVRMISRAESAPRRWPSTRGKPCCLAQRPLPSMMTATCCGSDARASALKCEVAELILLVRRLRGLSRRSKAKAERRGFKSSHDAEDKGARAAYPPVALSMNLRAARAPGARETNSALQILLENDSAPAQARIHGRRFYRVCKGVVSNQGTFGRQAGYSSRLRLHPIFAVFLR